MVLWWCETGMVSENVMQPSVQPYTSRVDMRRYDWFNPQDCNTNGSRDHEWTYDQWSFAKT